MGLTPLDILRVTAQIKSGQTASRMQNVYYWQAKTVVSQVFADIKADFAARLNQMYATINVFQSTLTVADGFRLIDLTQKETYGKGTWTYAGTAPGQEMMPPQVAAEMLAYTFTAGRYGRKYLGPFFENDQADGAWSAGILTAFGNFAALWNATWTGSVTGNTYDSGIVRKEAGVYTFKQFATALGTYVVPYARTQRRRTSGFGLT